MSSSDTAGAYDVYPGSGTTSRHPSRRPRSGLPEEYGHDVSLRLTRAEKVQANTELLRDTAQVIIRRDGWDGLTFQGLAREADLTVGAVYARFDSPSDVGIDLWQARVAEWFKAWVENIIDASERGDAQALKVLLEDEARGSALSIVTFKLMLASLFDDELDEVIGADIRATLEPHVAVGLNATKSDRHAAASQVLVLSFAFGRLLAERSSAASFAVPMDRYQALVAHATGSFEDVDAEPKSDVGWRRTLPDRHPYAEIAAAAMDLISQVGYRRATIARIARRAGVSRGSLLAGYPDKPALIADVATALMVPAGEVWETYVAAHGTMPTEQVRALFLRDFLDPARRADWALNLELNRVAGYEEAFAAYAVPRSVLEQTHLGVMVTACFAPDLSGLPYLGCFRAGIAAR